MSLEIKTNPEEFRRFHCLLTKDHPEYNPFYFPLNSHSKDPLEGISWKKNKITMEHSVKWLSKGYNIGIAATSEDKLVIMDKDDLEKVGATKPTLTTTSRKRIGEHSFYFTDDLVGKSIFDNTAKQNIATEDYGEIRSNWQYVVCAGSYVPVTEKELLEIPEHDKINAGKYTVKIECGVNNITFSELPEVYKDCVKQKRIVEIESKSRKETINTPAKNETKKSALWDLDISAVTGKNEDESKRFASLFHGSDTGKNTSIAKGLLHCWRHNVSLNPLMTLAVMAGMGDCSSIGIGHNGGGSSSLDLSDGETQFKLWDYAKKNSNYSDPFYSIKPANTIKS